MNKKKIVRLIILLLIIVVGSYFYAFVKRNVYLYDTEYSRSSMVSAVQIYDNNDFEYKFDCNKDKLTGMNLLLSAAAKSSKNGIIEYTLYDDEGNKVSDTRSIKISRFKNGKFTFLDFDTIDDSNGNSYLLKITCDKIEGSGAMVAVQPDDLSTVAAQYTFITWDLQTMIVFIISMLYLVLFIFVLLKIFRK